MDFKLHICLLLLLLGVLSVQGKNEPHVKAKRDDWWCEQTGGYCLRYHQPCEQMGMQYCLDCPPGSGTGEYCCCNNLRPGYNGGEYGMGK